MGKDQKPNKGSFKAGHARLPGAGRAKGTPNKKTLEFQAMLEREDFDPGAEMVRVYRAQMAIYEERNTGIRADGVKRARNVEGAKAALADASHTINNIAGFVFPRKKAVEHTGDASGLRTFADFMAAAVAGRDKK